jgi:inosine/xanthosine triphosphate pyrophosphatase family protein
MQSFLEFIRPALCINTSNRMKREAYSKYLGGRFNITFTDRPLLEVDSPDGMLVAAYKAKDAGENVVVEDTSLHIEGTDIGTNIKWRMSDVKKHVGKKAIMEVNMAVQNGLFVTVYSEHVVGVIGEGEGDGFDPYFYPAGSDKSLRDEPLVGNDDPRKKCCMRLCRLTSPDQPDRIYTGLAPWKGEIQK